MDLTTLTRVKAAIEISESRALPTSATVSDYLSWVIADWSRRAQGLLNREVAAGTHTEYLDVRPGQQVFSLKAYPVSSVVSVHFDSLREFTGTTVASDNYSCQTETGILRFDASVPVPGPGALKVVYVGGMAASAASFAAAYPDIAGAIEQQCAYAWERKGNLGRQAVNVGSGSVTYLGALDWLPGSKAVLLSHRRISFGG